MQNINIVLTSDQKYAVPLIATVTSVLENNKKNNHIIFHILENEIKGNVKLKIQNLEKKYNCRVIFYNFNLYNTKKLPIYDHLSKAVYLRLFIQDILSSDIKKIIYLDCDIVCLDDISYLYNENIENFPIGVITDIKSKDLIRLKRFNVEKYFNSGVMLINLIKWKKIVNIDSISSIIEKQDNKLVDADQEILNILFNNNYKELPKKYNLDLKHQIFKKVPKNTVILHYSDKVKPWSEIYPYKIKKYFFKYLSLNYQFLKTNNSFFIFIKKQKLYFTNLIKNILRPITPKRLLDLNKKRFFKKRENS